MIRLLSLLFIPIIATANVVTSFEQQIKETSQLDMSVAVENGDFNYFLFLVEYGNAKAIEFTPQMLEYTDASLTESIYISLARGLIKNPKKVLALAGIDVKNLCFVPFIEAPLDVEQIHIEQALQRLSNVSFDDKLMEHRRISCLNEFRKL